MNRNSVVKRLAEGPFKSLCAHLVSEMKRLKIPGISIAVWHNGVVQEVGLGVTSVEHPLTVTADTLFQIGSISKTMTGTMIMQLVESGALELDTPVVAYLPKLKLADAHTTKHVTTRHLLTHMGGWMGDYFNDFGTGDNALEAMVKSLKILPQTTPLGTLWSYNNTGFNIAGRLIEVLTNQTYERAAKQMLFDPLKLTNTFFYPDDAILTRRYAVAHQKWQGEARVATPWAIGRAANAVGGVVSTVGDLMRYAMFHSSDGADVMRASTLQQMRTKQVAAGGRGDMGLTWFIRTHGARTSYGHGGATKGQKATFRFLPDERFAIAILTNSDDGGMVGDSTVSKALELYFGYHAPAPQPIDMERTQLKEYVGEYDYALAHFRVGAAKGGIVIHETPKGGFPKPHVPAGPPIPAIRAKMLADDRFVCIDEPRMGEIGDFVRGADGAVAFLRIGGRANPRIK
jgi:CubicO group peptidase (beta-lactamase class C family)